MFRWLKFDVSLVFAIKILLFSVLLPGFVTPVKATEQAYDSCRSSYRELVSSPKKKLRHNWIKVIKCFESVSLRNTNGKQTDAVFTLGLIYHHLYTYSSIESDINNSLRYYRKVVDSYPGSILADDALFNRGKIFLEDKGDFPKAYLEFSELSEKYPDSDSSRRAAPIIAKIKQKKPKDTEVAQILEEPLKPIPGKVSSLKSVLEIKHWTNPEYTRVAVYLDSKTSFNFNKLDVDETNLRPRRIYVDIDDASYGRETGGEIAIKDGLLTRARLGRPKANTVRVVLDAEKDFDYNVFAWEEPFRIIIDIRSKTAGIAQGEVDLSERVEKIKPPEVEIEEDKEAKSEKIVMTPIKEEPLSPKPSERVMESRIEKRETTPKKEYLKVVIDPGHGGNDTGAVGRHGTMEKDVALAIAKKLRDILAKDEKIDVIMTRDEDVFVPLEDRTGMAVQAQADLFVSIHADAHKDRRIGGVSTYFLGDTDDKESIMTALKENYSTREYVGMIASSETKDILSYTLASLQKNYDTKRSIPLADSVQKHALANLRKSYSAVKNRGVRKGIFWVLCGTNSPAVLVETSYISNPQEEKRLKNEKYQEAIAKGIAEGLKQYLKNPLAMSGYDYMPNARMKK